ncbi:YihY/virulence factor BrkB family protein [Eubacterium sp. am_0171]|uniref:YihY/virulence factor BrkB family protein n=1 Tax=unclassified Eubacterium (in: firmicutes) TaxID=2624479 RepID=UPI00102103F5|nr:MULTISPECIES: YihY/virulence factor BrkB family protein [unclassified Eubacterium (in: firmicutes)]MSC84149.1 YihY family inner membrane protein [Eubacterium sp. BIOML-A1]MSD06184.1 YihY family inner membrane protein [Eubacterium sp. BIOML-A2]RYT21430.1 YihY/virulence factor BrkB family protein [Eubacterium sp. am_0171]
MKGRVKSITRKINRLASILGSHHTGAYAAQAAYFFVLSLIPIILLLLTMVQFTPVTRQDVMAAVTQVFPTSVEGLISSIVDQVYRQSSTIIPVTIIVALWSAGKGVLAMTSGMNLIYENTETRNYFYLRLRASFYTVIFILAIVLSLSLSVFGNSISIIVYKHVPVLTTIMDFLIRIRTLLTLVVLTLFWDMVYKYLPNRTNLSKTTMKQQLPGAVFTSCGWLLISFIFSVYLDIFTGFSSMYGSLTTIILIMLWLYVCMYVILLGGELNALLEGLEERKGDRMRK